MFGRWISYYDATAYDPSYVDPSCDDPVQNDPRYHRMRYPLASDHYDAFIFISSSYCDTGSIMFAWLMWCSKGVL